MGADGLTCGVCGTAYYGGSNICFRTPESTAAHWKKGYERQRARADAAERERDEAKLFQQVAENNLANERKIIDGDKEAWRKAIRADRERVKQAEATIATLREEVERKDKALREVEQIAADLSARSNEVDAATEHHKACRWDNCMCWKRGARAARARWRTYKSPLAALSPPKASTTTQGGEG